VKIEAAVAALAVMAVETFASVMGVATADGDGDVGQNRVTMKVSCNEEGGGDGGKSDGDEVGGRATVLQHHLFVCSSVCLEYENT
jgi:hypothetical protein